MLFSYQQIKKLNSTEANIFDYVIRNTDEVMKMSVRDLAAATFVSTATITRFCKKLDCDGYPEFKTRLKMFHESQTTAEEHDEIQSIQDFFTYTTGEEFQHQIDACIDLMVDADITFLGIGSSGILGNYGARMFSNFGIFSLSVSDPYYPPRLRNMSPHVLIVLSVSGETREVIDQVRLYKQLGSKIVLISNHSESTIAKMADAGVYYYVQDIVLPQTYNVSTNVPVVYILEKMAGELSDRVNKKMPLITSTRNVEETE